MKLGTRNGVPISILLVASVRRPDKHYLPTHLTDMRRTRHLFAEYSFFSSTRGTSTELSPYAGP